MNSNQSSGSGTTGQLKSSGSSGGGAVGQKQPSINESEMNEQSTGIHQPDETGQQEATTQGQRQNRDEQQAEAQPS